MRLCKAYNQNIGFIKFQLRIVFLISLFNYLIISLFNVPTVTLLKITKVVLVYQARI